MKKFLRFVFPLIVLNVFEIDAMELTYDYDRMYQNTSKESRVSEISTTVLSSGEMVDDAKIRDAAISGDYVAQYLLAQQAGGKARSAHNGERKRLLMEKAMLLSISAIRGGYWKSLDEISSTVPAELRVDEYPDLLTIQRLAESVYKDL